MVKLTLFYEERIFFFSHDSFLYSRFYDWPKKKNLFLPAFVSFLFLFTVLSFEMTIIKSVISHSTKNIHKFIIKLSSILAILLYKKILLIIFFKNLSK